jgi:hypothetical protein
VVTYWIVMTLAYVSLVRPGHSLIDECRFVGDAAIQALGAQDAELGLRHVQPTGVLGRVVDAGPLTDSSSAAGRT